MAIKTKKSKETLADKNISFRPLKEQRVKWLAYKDSFDFQDGLRQKMTELIKECEEHLIKQNAG